MSNAVVKVERIEEIEAWVAEQSEVVQDVWFKVAGRFERHFREVLVQCEPYKTHGVGERLVDQFEHDVTGRMVRSYRAMVYGVWLAVPKQIRAEMGMETTKKGFAESLGVSNRTVFQYEKTYPWLKTFCQSAFDVSGYFAGVSAESVIVIHERAVSDRKDASKWMDMENKITGRYAPEKVEDVTGWRERLPEG